MSQHISTRSNKNDHDNCADLIDTMTQIRLSRLTKIIENNIYKQESVLNKSIIGYKIRKNNDIIEGKFVFYGLKQCGDHYIKYYVAYDIDKGIIIKKKLESCGCYADNGYSIITNSCENKKKEENNIKFNIDEEHNFFQYSKCDPDYTVKIIYIGTSRGNYISEDGTSNIFISKNKRGNEKKLGYIQIVYSRYLWMKTSQFMFNYDTSLRVSKGGKNKKIGDLYTFYDFVVVPFTTNNVKIKMKFFGSDNKIINNEDIETYNCEDLLHETEINFDFPGTQLKGDYDVCNICLEKYDESNSHINYCGHVFCNDCYWNYLVSKNKIISEEISNLANCPVCRREC
jgi:hypothetical protein